MFEKGETNLSRENQREKMIKEMKEYWRKEGFNPDLLEEHNFYEIEGMLGIDHYSIMREQCGFPYLTRKRITQCVEKLLAC